MNNLKTLNKYVLDITHNGKDKYCDIIHVMPIL